MPREHSGRNDTASGRQIAFLIPTGLTLARLLAGLIYFWLPPPWRLPVILAAFLSDLADGAVSRLLGAQSRLGQLLDPIADKVFTAAVVFTWLFEGIISPVETLFVCLRDIFILLGALWYCRKHGWISLTMMKSRFLGKLTTGLQFCFFLACLWQLDAFRLPFLVASALIGALSTLDYFRAYQNLHAMKPAEPASPGIPRNFENP